MPRRLVFLVVLLVLVIAAMFYLSTIDTEQQPAPVEKPIIGEMSE